MSSHDSNDAEARARAWHRARLTAVCDVIEPWDHGTVVRATRYPEYYDLNCVVVEGEPALSTDELMAFADQALSGLEHRRVDFDRADAAAKHRAAFEAKGWEASRLVWMRHEAPLPPGPDIEVEEVPYDAAEDLRLTWNKEDFPNLDTTVFRVQSREVALSRGARVLVVREQGLPVAFAQLEWAGAAAEVTHVYVHPEHRGELLGTALTRAAIGSAGSVSDLWIVADDEDRPKELYRRLGFRPAWTSMEFMRLPLSTPGP
jgi:GNAT superfamily N-acetyltransferase